MGFQTHLPSVKIYIPEVSIEKQPTFPGFFFFFFNVLAQMVLNALHTFLIMRIASLIDGIILHMKTVGAEK